MRNISVTDVEALRSVKAGEFVRMEGALLAMRDRTLAQLSAMAERGESLPVSLAGRVIFFAGPTPGLTDGRGAVGPTTSRRMAAYLPFLCDAGPAALIGKGLFDEEGAKGLFSHNILYLQAIGGAGAYYGSRVGGVAAVAFKEYGPEALFELTVRDFVVMMTLDGAGAARR